MAYGSGGALTSKLIREVFQKEFDNEILNKMEDAAILDVSSQIAFTTDSFVVEPMFFPGGDIGKLAVCGTVNDLAMMGAKPLYLTVGFILETGVDMEDLKKIVESMGKVCKEAGVKIVAGDTKVIVGSGNVYINTSGVGSIQKEGISITNGKVDDVILINGGLGEHQSSIMSKRMGITNSIISDCCPLNGLVEKLMEQGVRIHAMRDLTRGGLATVLNELSEGSNCRIRLLEEHILVEDTVRGFCDILGLDPLYMANEGKMMVVVPKEEEEKALRIMRAHEYGKKAVSIGNLMEGNGVYVQTKMGGTRMVSSLMGEGLPRIC